MWNEIGLIGLVCLWLVVLYFMPDVQKSIMLPLSKKGS